MSVYSDFKVDLNNPNSTWTIVYNYIKPGSKILDVGCSSGYFDQVLIENKNCVIDGIELDPQDAAKASKICRNLAQDNIETMDLNRHGLDSDYDYIIFADVLEHLIDPVATLKKVAKILKPSGSVIFSIPNMANGSVRLQLLQGNMDAQKSGLLDATHFHFYTYATVEKMIKDSGLFTSKIRYTTYDVPEKIVDQILSKVGLSNSKEFMDFIRSKDSVIYQFVGQISKTRPKNPVSITSSVKAIKPSVIYDKQLASVQQDARTTFQNLVKSNETVEALSKENEELRRRLSRLHKNPVIKTGLKVRNVIRGKK